MKKVLFLLFLLFPVFLGTAFVNAQVKIGGDAEPEKGAVLDLKASAPGDYVGGLLLSRAAITNLDDVPDSWTVVKSELTTGLLVFNDDDSINPKGIYVWNGTKWQAMITV